MGGRFQCQKCGGDLRPVCVRASLRLPWTPERNYRDICSLLHHSLEDRIKSYAYVLQIKEILVSGELAIVRLVWTLRIRSNNAPGFAKSVEPGVDIFRKQPDGSWKIIRYMAYEEPE